MKHFRNELTEEEKMKLEEWLVEDEERRNILDSISNDEKMDEGLSHFFNANVPAVFARFKKTVSG